MLSGWAEARERYRDLVLAHQHTREAVCAEVIGDGGNLGGCADAFQRDSRIRPNRLHMVGVDGKDDSADARALGGPGGCERHNEQHCG